MGRQAGFTLIELLIVIVIIVVVALIAIPNLLASRMLANETTAIATLRTIIACQSQFQRRAIADEDRDGWGEYGTFGEMSAATGVRSSPTMLAPAVIPSSFRSVNAQGAVVRSGYLYRMYLPDPSGTGLPETAGGGAPAGIGADLAETTWCCYAWPTSFQSSGVRTFFVNQGGDVLATENPAYNGPLATLDAGSAFRAPGSSLTITGLAATGQTGRDGSFWSNVPN
ncbi:MAG: prepilin-type N-terminal cleavage/methylation domain-containing protein [Candidatus Binatia bacterium]